MSALRGFILIRLGENEQETEKYSVCIYKRLEKQIFLKKILELVKRCDRIKVQMSHLCL